MAGTKRSSEGGPDTRTRKVAKTNSEEKAKGGRRGTKGKSKAIPRSTFKTEALPIHVNFTHTPAAVIDDEEQPSTSLDPGHIGSVTLLPTEFSTGSYGWKGARRIAVELQGAEGKEKEKVQVMININATVVGSKGTAEETGEEKQDLKEGEEEDVAADKVESAEDVEV